MKRAAGMRLGRRAMMGAAFLSAMTITACSEQITQPQGTVLIPPAPPSNPQILSAGWKMFVNRNTQEIKITAPTGNGLNNLDAQVLADYFSVEPSSPEFSILAGDVVEIQADNSTFLVGTVGQYLPGLVRTSFDVRVRNKLTGVQLETPTFPAPPAGTNGVVLFPYDIAVLETPGGVTGGLGDGTTVLVELPNYGDVAPSIEWDVEPHNFFNDNGCTDNYSTSNPTTDCYRSEVFGSSAGQYIEAGSTSEWRQIGFDHDPTVSMFEVRMILAADLGDATPNTPPTADAGPTAGGNYIGQAGGAAITLQGSASDPDAGATFTYAWDLDDNGTFETPGQNPSYTCSTIGLFDVNLRVTDNRGGTGDDSAIVDCQAAPDFPPVAEANGPYTIEVGSSGNLSSAGSSDDGAIAAYDWDLDNNGSFETPGQSPSFNCTTLGSFTVVLRVTDDATPTAQTDTDNATVNCAAPSAGVINARWVDGSGAPISSAASGGTAILELDVDMDAGEEIGLIQATIDWAVASLTANSAADLACPAGTSCPSGIAPAGNVDQLTSLTPNTSVAGEAQLLSLNVDAVPNTGAQHGWARITFTLGSAGAVTPIFTLDGAGNTNGDPISLTVGAMPALTITP